MSPTVDANAASELDAGRQRSRLLAALVGILTFLLFLRAATFGFVDWDDSTNVFNNPFYSPVTALHIAQFWWRPFHELFTPVTNTLWGLCCLIALRHQPIGVLGSGYSYYDPLPFHLLGVAFHAATAIFVYLLLVRLTRDTAAASVGALFWAFHPLQVESVAWVTGNNNVFSGFFGIVALWAYVRAIQDRNAQPSAMVAPSIYYALAILAKPTAVVVPLVVGVIDALILRRPSRKWLPVLAVWSVLAIVLALITKASSGASAGVTIALWKRPVIVLDALAFYLGRVVVPTPLAVDYGRLPDLVVHHAWGYAYAAVTLATMTICVVLYRRRPGPQWPLSALGILIAGVLPMAGVVPYYFMKVSTVADRYVYIALLGPAYAIASVLAALRGRYRLLIGSVALVPYATLTWIQLGVWHDSVSLFSHAVAVNPASAIAHNNLGVALADRSQYDAALSEALRVHGMRPTDANAINNLGVAYGENGDRAQAIAAFREAIRQRPDFAGPHYHLGVTLADAGDSAGAIVPLQDAVRLQPKFPEAWFRLGIVLGKTGRLAEAVDALAEDLKQRPGDVTGHYLRGVLLGNLKRDAEAEAEFLEVTRRAPTSAEAWYGLGKMRARRGHVAGARAALAKAIDLDPTNTDAKAALQKLLAQGVGQP